jgi:hypothetical protein
VSDCAADCLRGHSFKAAVPGHFFSYFTVCHGLAVGDGQENIPDFPAEWGPVKRDGINPGSFPLK